MKTIKLKTNINCGGCKAKVAPYLNANPGIKEWNVDTVNPQKVITVQTENLKNDDITELIRKSGFKAELL